MKNQEFFFKVEKCIYLKYISYLLEFDTHDWHSILYGLFISSKGDINNYPIFRRFVGCTMHMLSSFVRLTWKSRDSILLGNNSNKKSEKKKNTVTEAELVGSIAEMNISETKTQEQKTDPKPCELNGNISSSSSASNEVLCHRDVIVTSSFTCTFIASPHISACFY